MMANIRKWLEEAEGRYGERIEAIVVGKHYDDEYKEEERRPEHQRDVVLSRDDGLALLDDEYDNGFGGAHCFPMYAWTASRVFFIHEYDGATGMNYAPRNPGSIKTEFGGQDPDMEVPPT